MSNPKTFVIGDTEMNYVEFGRGKTPLIILPGVGDGLQHITKSTRALHYLYRKYARKYRVYICSRKNKLLSSTTTGDMAEDIAKFMKSLQLPPAHVMGVGLGGMIAQHLAIHYPTYIHKLIIAMSSSQPNPISTKVFTGWIRMTENKRYEELFVDVMQKTYTDQYLRKYRPLYFILRRIGRPENDRQFILQLKAAQQHQSHHSLFQISCPTLVAGSFHDKIVGPEASKVMAQQIPNSQLQMYSYYGHGAYQESSTFEADMIAFLEK